MAIKKSELYSTLWKSCDELRGGMDASQYKDYVLVLLFVKYVSDKYAGQPNALIEVPEGGSFADIAALKGDKEIGDKINKIIARLAEANDLKGVIDVADFNDPDKLGKGKEMQDRLSNLPAFIDGFCLLLSLSASLLRAVACRHLFQPEIVWPPEHLHVLLFLCPASGCTLLLILRATV